MMKNLIFNSTVFDCSIDTIPLHLHPTLKNKYTINCLAYSQLVIVLKTKNDFTQ